jgi:guanylate kinase
VRELFNRDYVLTADWYKARLVRFQKSQISLSERNISYLEDFLKEEKNRYEAARLGIHNRLEKAKKRLAMVSDSSYLDCLAGTLGLDALYRG